MVRYVGGQDSVVRLKFQTASYQSFQGYSFFSGDLRALGVEECLIVMGAALPIDIGDGRRHTFDRGSMESWEGHYACGVSVGVCYRRLHPSEVV